MAENDEKRSSGGCALVAVLSIVAIAFVGIVVVGSFDRSSERTIGDEMVFDEDFDDRDRALIRGLDSAAIAFDDQPAPTLEIRLADMGDERLRELEFFLPEGDDPIEFAVRNPEPIRIDGQGIAVRTDEFAQILRSSRTFAIERRADCIDGNCRLFMWLTMGPDFLDNHPEAELLIWAGEEAAVTIEPMPVENFRDETFR